MISPFMTYEYDNNTKYILKVLRKEGVYYCILGFYCDFKYEINISIDWLHKEQIERDVQRFYLGDNFRETKLSDFIPNGKISFVNLRYMPEFKQFLISLIEKGEL